MFYPIQRGARAVWAFLAAVLYDIVVVATYHARDYGEVSATGLRVQRGESPSRGTSYAYALKTRASRPQTETRRYGVISHALQAA